MKIRREDGMGASDPAKNETEILWCARKLERRLLIDWGKRVWCGECLWWTCCVSSTKAQGVCNFLFRFTRSPYPQIKPHARHFCTKVNEQGKVPWLHHPRVGFPEHRLTFRSLPNPSNPKAISWLHKLLRCWQATQAATLEEHPLPHAIMTPLLCGPQKLRPTMHPPTR